MNEKNIRLVTAESVRASHPDKFCDQVADAILDAHLRQDPNARVAVEVFATAGKIVVGGEITSKAKVSYDKIVAGVINRIGYTMSDLCGDSHGLLELEVCLHEQSPDISAAVGKSMLDAGKTLGAGDQGIMVGYATNETEEYLPLPVVLAHRICRRLDELNGTQYDRITAAKDGSTFDWVATAENGWHAVVVNGRVGWVSGKYAERA